MIIHNSRKDRIASIRIVAYYVLFGSLWILFSDTIVGRITKNPDLIQRLSVFKGLAFILITAFLLYHLINRHLQRMSAANSLLQANMDQLETAHEKLKLTELAIENTSDSIQWITMDSRFWNVNRAACSMLGYTREEYLSLSISDIDPYFTLEEWQTHLQEIKQTGNIHHARFHKTKDGIIFPVEITSTYIKYDDIDYYCAIVRDITERVKVENEASFFKSLIEYTRDPFYVLSPEKGFQMAYANQAACQHYGMDLEQLQTMSVPDWDPAFDMGSVDDLMKQQRAGHSLRFETVHKVASGKLIPVEVTSSLLVHGGREYICGYFYDITERKKMVEALRESEARYRMLSLEYQALLEGVPDGLTLLTPDLRVLWANPASARATAQEPGDLAGRYCYEIRHGSDAPCEKCVVLETFKTGEARKTVIVSPPTGRTFDLRSVPVKDEDGKVVKVIEVVRDITEQVMAETERLDLERKFLHAQKLESLGVLAGGIAHDFNNILTSIIGNADLALMRMNPESPGKENLHRIEQAAARAADLAKQMLAYSGKGKFMVENINLNRLLEEMLHMLEVSISKNAVLRFNLNPNLPTVEVDATQIRQIVMNLVINASEAIGDKSGVIAITTGCLDCDKSYLKDVWLDENIGDGLYVYLEIADTGCGMDKDTMTKIFDPFFTTKFTGRGLGMAAVLGIVRGHRGAIKIYSEPNKGTTFKILLPASNRPVEIFNHDSHVDEWKGSGTVLLVDDEETVRGIGKELLQELGFTTITANDGREAVEIFRNTPDISFVILDLTMPHMDGEQCFRELRQLNQNVKVIMCSGFSEHEVTQKFVGKGLAGFIQKPYKMSVLKEAIQRI
ncbi:MAG: PAS domain S-box protein [Desulfuromonadales bacterium]|nr:PAS domain S-box protein [Desulfuromonadales bacterium]